MTMHPICRPPSFFLPKHSFGPEDSFLRRQETQRQPSTRRRKAADVKSFKSQEASRQVERVVDDIGRLDYLLLVLLKMHFLCMFFLHVGYVMRRV